METEYNLAGKDRIEVGRGTTNDIVIPDCKRFKTIPPVSQRMFINDLIKISRLHARLTFNKEDNNWYIEDVDTQGLGSNYGTFVNNARIDVKKPYKLTNNDKIKFGPIECIFSQE